MKFFAPIKLSENISKTPEGYLACRNVSIGRVGEMIYGVGETPIAPGPDGKVYIMRSAEELFRAETMASFEGKDITILHPEDFVNPENWSQLSQGVVMNVRKGTGEKEGDLVADFLVKSQEAIQLVEKGLREVSCGYEAEYTKTGVGRGVQTSIIGNHVALVEQGRAGSAYAINDHRKGSKMKFSDLFKSPKVAKALDDAMAQCDEGGEQNEKPMTMKDMQSYMDAALKKMTDSFAEMMGKKKEGEDATEVKPQEPQTGKPAEPVAKDEEPATGGLEERIAKLEELVKTLVSREAKEDEVPVGDEEEEPEAGETGDSAPEEEDEAELAARVEILAPGLKATGKDAKSKALLKAYGTTDGKAVIDTFTGGKLPNLKDEALVSALFVATSELLREKRSNDLARSVSTARDNSRKALAAPKGVPTPEELNKKNEEFYAAKK